MDFLTENYPDNKIDDHLIKVLKKLFPYYHELRLVHTKQMYSKEKSENKVREIESINNQIVQVLSEIIE